MEIWHEIVSGLVTLAAVVGAVKGLTKPILDKLNKITSNEQRLSELESWTKKQQLDLLDMSRKLTMTFEASIALLDNAIVNQNGNGECHKAKAKMESYMRDKLTSLNSYMDE